AIDRNLELVLAVEEVVDRISVTAGDDHSRRAAGVNALRQLGLVDRPRSSEDLRLREVRRHHGRERQQPPGQRSVRVVLEPWQPMRANAFRSAWIPAPPPESDVAIVKQRGVNSLPSPALPGSGSRV